MTMQIVFTEDEWREFRQKMCMEFIRKAKNEFRIVDRETDNEIIERLSDYCWGQMTSIIDVAMQP